MHGFVSPKTCRKLLDQIAECLFDWQTKKALGAIFSSSNISAVGLAAIFFKVSTENAYRGHIPKFSAIKAE